MKFAKYVEQVVTIVTGETDSQIVDALAFDLEAALTDAGENFKAEEKVNPEMIRVVMLKALEVFKGYTKVEDEEVAATDVLKCYITGVEVTDAEVTELYENLTEEEFAKVTEYYNLIALGGQDENYTSDGWVALSPAAVHEALKEKSKLNEAPLTGKDIEEFIHERVDVWDDGDENDWALINDKLQNKVQLTHPELYKLKQRFRSEGAYLIEEAGKEYSHEPETLLEQTAHYIRFWGAAVDALERGLFK